jgi:hypothetical protein
MRVGVTFKSGMAAKLASRIADRALKNRNLRLSAAVRMGFVWRLGAFWGLRLVKATHRLIRL